MRTRLASLASLSIALLAACQSARPVRSAGACEGIPAAVPAKVHGLAVVNVMPRFWQFIDSSRTVNRQEAIAQFRRIVVCPDTVVYHAFAGGPTDEQIDRYLSRVVADTAAMRVLDARIIDPLAGRHAERGQTAPFLDHELFHLYNASVTPGGRSAPDHGAFYQSIWGEGLATYASIQLNPSGSLAEALLDSAMIARTAARLRELSGEIRARLDSTSRVIHDDYLSI